MDLILWRHADAAEGERDMERKLTAKGCKQAARMAEWLTARLPSRTLVLASPARRSCETADALGTSVATVEREWRFARALLFHQLSGQTPESPQD